MKLAEKAIGTQRSFLNNVVGIVPISKHPSSQIGGAVQMWQHQLLKANSKAELIWASPRELLNIFHADAVGCHIITVTHDILNKLPLVGKDLAEYSLDTVKMFYQDARSAGFQIETTR